MYVAGVASGSKRYDRRCLKTEHAIESVVGEMIKSGRSTNLNVREICAKSGTSPATFYRHFDNAEDVMGRKVLRLKLEFELEKLPKYKHNSDCFASIVGTLLFFCKHKDFFEITIKSQSLNSVHDIVVLLKPIICERWSRYNDSVAERLFFMFCTEMVGVVCWWCVYEEFDLDVVSEHANYLFWLAENMTERMRFWPNKKTA